MAPLLEDRASPSHLLITVISEAQPANNGSGSAASWRRHVAQADEEREGGAALRTDRAQLGLPSPSGLLSKSAAHVRRVSFHNNAEQAAPYSQSRLICKNIH